MLGFKENSPLKHGWRSLRNHFSHSRVDNKALQAGSLIKPSRILLDAMAQYEVDSKAGIYPEYSLSDKDGVVYTYVDPNTVILRFHCKGNVERRRELKVDKDGHTHIEKIKGVFPIEELPEEEQKDWDIVENKRPGLSGQQMR